MSHIDTFDSKPTNGDRHERRRLLLRHHRHGHSRRESCASICRAREDGRPLRARAHRESQRHRRARRRDESHAHRPPGERQRGLSVSIGSIVAHQRKAAARGRAAVRGHRLPERHARARLPRAESRLRLSHRHRERPRRPHPAARRSPPSARRAAKRCSPACATITSTRIPTSARSAITTMRSTKASACRAATSCAPSSSAKSPARCAQSTAMSLASAACSRRRLIQRGVRFVEVGFNLNFVNGAGWDTHNAAQKEQHGLIRRLDQGVAALVTDLERQRLLDKTLIVIATEFGRPAQFRRRRRARPLRQMLHLRARRRRPPHRPGCRHDRRPRDEHRRASPWACRISSPRSSPRSASTRSRTSWTASAPCRSRMAGSRSRSFSGRLAIL